MTIETPILQVEKYAGDGVTKTFGFGFRTFDAVDVVVISADANGNETTLSAESDYYVTLNSSGQGGTVTLGKALAKGTLLVITRQVPLKQEVDLVNQGEFYAETIESAFDRFVAIAQDLREWAGRHITVPISSNKTPQEVLDEILNIAARANDYSQQAKVILDQAIIVDQTIKDNAQSVSLMKSSVDASERNVTNLANQVNEYSDELVMVAENLDAIQTVDNNEEVIAALAADLQGYPIYEFDGGEIDEPNESMNGVGGVMKVCADNIETIKQVAESLKNSAALMNLAETVDEIGSTDYTTINETGQTGA